MAAVRNLILNSYYFGLIHVFFLVSRLGKSMWKNATESQLLFSCVTSGERKESWV